MQNNSNYLHLLVQQISKRVILFCKLREGVRLCSRVPVEKISFKFIYGKISIEQTLRFFHTMSRSLKLTLRGIFGGSISVKRCFQLFWNFHFYTYFIALGGGGVPFVNVFRILEIQGM